MTDVLLKDGERYELLGELASGGMATVYLARMRRQAMGFSRLVAIKCMHPQFAKDPSFVSMFMDEARLTARLRHPNIVPTVDIVADDGHLLLVMEYVEGASLAMLLRNTARAGARVPASIACAIMHDVLLGLHDAHQAKDDDGSPLAIIHRDVSPQNVLVGLDGLSRVLDFGVAKARANTHRSNDNEIKGKVPYMPPEQLFGEAIDHRVDVYAAGVSLWEALVGERLFDGPSETVLVKKISEDPITRPSSRIAELPAGVDEVVMKALSRNPQDRYQSCLEMAEALARALALPTRTEVSSWVRQYVTPKEIPSGVKLPSTSSSITSLPAIPQEQATVVTDLLKVNTNPATTILAILEKASMVRSSVKRPALTPMPGSVSAADIEPAIAAMRGRSRVKSLAIGLAALALGFGAVGVARVATVQAAPKKVTAQVQAPTTGEPTPLSVAAPTINPAPALAPSPAIPEEKPAPATTPANVSAAPRAKTATPRIAAAVPAAPKAEPANCAKKFTIDAQGFKHFKAECM